MKKAFCFLVFIFILLSGLTSHAQQAKRDTVSVGIYVTSIHDIDFKQKEYTITFWLWLKYKNKAFDFENNLEVPQAKTVTKSFTLKDTTGEKIYMQMKLQCVMKDSWKIGNFPFDRQKLRLSLENSQYDSRYLIFVPDTVGENYDKRFTLSGWTIDSFIVLSGTKIYETGFGDATLAKPHTEYSAYRVRISINRDAAGLFWKMFLGMYIAFLIAYITFYIHHDSIDSRFNLSVGSIFAVIGNKYIIDSSLPESTSFTLVDMLHALTLFSILTVITINSYSLKLVKAHKIKKAQQFDMIAAQVLLGIYIILNIYFISQASGS